MVSLLIGFLCSAATEDTITSAVKRMSAGISSIKKEINQHQKPQEWADKFAEKMKGFLEEAEAKFKKVQDQHTLMEKKFDELSEYYCFDRKKVPMEELFGDISQFCKDFDVSLVPAAFWLFTHFVCDSMQRARKENAKMKEQIEKQRLAREREVSRNSGPKCPD